MCTWNMTPTKIYIYPSFKIISLICSPCITSITSLFHSQRGMHAILLSNTYTYFETYFFDRNMTWASESLPEKPLQLCFAVLAGTKLVIFVLAVFRELVAFIFDKSNLPLFHHIQGRFIFFLLDLQFRSNKCHCLWKSFELRCWCFPLFLLNSIWILTWKPVRAHILHNMFLSWFRWMKNA